MRPCQATSRSIQSPAFVARAVAIFGAETFEAVVASKGYTRENLPGMVRIEAVAAAGEAEAASEAGVAGRTTGVSVATRLSCSIFDSSRMLPIEWPELWPA